MRKLWSDHAFWTREYIVAAVADDPDQAAAAGRLMKNQEDIGAAVAAYYGDAAGAKLTSLLKEHISIAVDLIKAAKAGDTAGQQRADAAWHRNGEDIAGFLSQANPNWPRPVLVEMMNMHLSTTTDEVVARLTKDWDEGRPRVRRGLPAPPEHVRRVVGRDHRAVPRPLRARRVAGGSHANTHRPRAHVVGRRDLAGAGRSDETAARPIPASPSARGRSGPRPAQRHSRPVPRARAVRRARSFDDVIEKNAANCWNRAEDLPVRHVRRRGVLGRHPRAPQGHRRRAARRRGPGREPGDRPRGRPEGGRRMPSPPTCCRPSGSGRSISTTRR